MSKGFRPFRIYKFRTMVRDASRLRGPITFGTEPRLTWVGRVLRKTKIDEFPSLINILRGEKLCQTRPEVRQFVEWFREDYEESLKVWAGITDLASLQYKNVERQLPCQGVHHYVRQSDRPTRWTIDRSAGRGGACG